MTQNERALERIKQILRSSCPTPCSIVDPYLDTIRHALQQNENLVYALQIAKRDIGNWVTHEEARDSAIACIDKHLAEYEKEIV